MPQTLVSNHHKLRKGGLITFDVFLAAVTVLFILYFGFVILNVLVSRSALAREELTLERKLFIASDRLVKVELAKSDGTQIYAHELNSTEFENYNIESMRKSLALNALSVILTSSSYSHFIGNSSGERCATRVVYITDKNEVGKLEICVS
ncbi:MAG: hypothetical protein ABIH99_06015 [Candidatus Micrarchaeota archaeon]